MQINLEDRSRFFKALGDSVRLRIVQYLLERTDCACICELSEHLGRDQSVIFRHVQILRESGIVSAGKQDKHLMCCIADRKRIRHILEA